MQFHKLGAIARDLEPLLNGLVVLHVSLAHLLVSLERLFVSLERLLVSLEQILVNEFYSRGALHSLMPDKHSTMRYVVCQASKAKLHYKS